MASGHRKVVKEGRYWPVPRGACGADGAPAPGNGATTPLPETGVRKHPAPEGALRLSAWSTGSCSVVRKHPAPEGALRRRTRQVKQGDVRCQKAPSTRRCIKTSPSPMRRIVSLRQKAPSTRRCIKTLPPDRRKRIQQQSESTQHQKVH